MVTTTTARSLLDAAQQKFLRERFGNWQLVEMLIEPDNKNLLGWPWVGGSYSAGKPDLSYDGKGIWQGPWTGWDDAELRVTWRLVRSYARSLPENLRARMNTNRACRRTSQSNYERAGILPHDLTPEGCRERGVDPASDEVREARAQVHAEWQEREKVWRAQSDLFNEAMGALLDEALPLADGLCRCPGMRLPHLWTEGMCDLGEAV